MQIFVVGDQKKEDEERSRRRGRGGRGRGWGREGGRRGETEITFMK